MPPVEGVIRDFPSGLIATEPCQIFGGDDETAHFSFGLVSSGWVKPLLRSFLDPVLS
jgi:hypothetical protein